MLKASRVVIHTLHLYPDDGVFGMLDDQRFQPFNGRSGELHGLRLIFLSHILVHVVEKLVSRLGLEPRALALKGRCSTD